MDIVVVELGLMVQLRLKVDIDLAVELVVNVEKNLRPLILIVVLRASMSSGTRNIEVEGIRAGAVGAGGRGMRAADEGPAARMAAIIEAFISGCCAGDLRLSRCLCPLT